MNICFVLPQVSRQPSGGYKIVFEYANRFIKKGHEVSIVFKNDNAYKKFHLPEFIRLILTYYMTEREPRWFELENKIKKISSTDKNLAKKLGTVDVCIATAAITVDFAKTIKSKKHAYFIQGYENWNLPEEYLVETYKSGMKNIVVAEWLKNKVSSYCQGNVSVVRNPIDIKQYKPLIPNERRKVHSIGLLYHTAEKKGLTYAFQALYALKERYTDLTVDMFGVFDPPKILPEWINYTKNASTEETVKIYNRVSVFLCATVEEGYGLTGLEAMACGAALVSSNYQGVREYAIDGYNSLLAPIKDSKALAERVSCVFDNSLLRTKIVKNGVDSVREYSWENATDTFLSILRKTVDNNSYV